MDPTGRVARMGALWRINGMPDFMKRVDTGELQRCTGSAFTSGDFVKVLVSLDLVRTSSDYARQDVVSVGLAIDTVTRLFTKDELTVRALITISMRCSPVSRPQVSLTGWSNATWSPQILRVSGIRNVVI